MRELLRRLRLAPLATARLVFATTLVNLLAFASPLFVMLILGQYVESGFDGTLYTLAAGMGIALLLQAAFQQLRTPWRSSCAPGRTAPGRGRPDHGPAGPGSGPDPCARGPAP
jgi:ATP-binding cassette subfamily C protein LapB